jgi:hypothetical protein
MSVLTRRGHDRNLCAVALLGLVAVLFGSCGADATAHLAAGCATRYDLVLGSTEVADLLAQPVVAEEKLDGVNVVPWLEAG